MIDDLEIRDIKLRGAITEINREIRSKLFIAKCNAEDASKDDFTNFESCIKSVKEAIDDAVKLYESIRKKPE